VRRQAANAHQIVAGLHGTSPPISYPANDAIYPGGRKKSHDEIVRFMEKRVMPWARQALGPVVGAPELVTCNACHGGGVTPGREGRIFGPDLAGVTRRLSRVELADALVYPSKQVPDRFKAFEIELKDATPLTGFITEQDTEAVTLADREQVHRIARSQIRAITPQNLSLMPANLLNRLSWEDIRDLMAFLSEGNPAPK
jgi:putative heme-binding domain-containing protein